MAFVYILYSKSTDNFYTGSCLDLDHRLQQHLDKTFFNSFTKKASDWVLYFSIANLGYQQARKIEIHIKMMKSRKYIENLKKYPEMAAGLIEKYTAGSSR
ncbi:hypothetical protein AEQU2_00621 [Aequorivita lipolytica]|uniref:GIY-YIG nuclease family protein n=1 Tax=Aequorivita lipolytica TaxID=153267 RepID=UPI000DBC05BE|nr:GIY-YIG nuclease family protein [Aequorivita lipolytica]SRX50152.1 hypothetical protein AEQU2_00621 [Aequorivita lipolytica]